VLITLGWFTEHGQPFDARATGFHLRLRHFVDSRVPESWCREVIEGQGWGMSGAPASPVGWKWNLISRDRDRLVATVSVPVGLGDGVLNGGPIGVGRSVRQALGARRGSPAVRRSRDRWHPVRGAAGLVGATSSLARLWPATDRRARRSWPALKAIPNHTGYGLRRRWPVMPNGALIWNPCA
jgi:hypothetical protein